MYNYEPLDSMYPDVYYRVYPYVKQMCEMYDNSSNPDLYPYPTREAIEKMTDSIYNRYSACQIIPFFFYLVDDKIDAHFLRPGYQGSGFR